MLQQSYRKVWIGLDVTAKLLKSVDRIGCYSKVTEKCGYDWMLQRSYRKVWIGLDVTAKLQKV